MLLLPCYFEKPYIFYNIGVSDLARNQKLRANDNKKQEESARLFLKSEIQFNFCATPMGGAVLVEHTLRGQGMRVHPIKIRGKCAIEDNAISLAKSISIANLYTPCYFNEGASLIASQEQIISSYTEEG